MNMRRSSARCATLALMALASLAGCAGGPKAPQGPPIFYPPAPDVPRIQFLLSFSDAEQWVRKSSSFSSYVVGAAPTVSTEIRKPYGLAARDGRIYICDIDASKVHVIDLAKKTYSVLGSPDELSHPVNVTIDSDGTRYVCDTRLGKVAVFNAEGRFTRYLGNPDRCVPGDVAISGDELFVADARPDAPKVEVWSKDGELLRVLAKGGVGPDAVHMPTNLDVGPKGQVYVAESMESVVNEYDREGRFRRPIGGPGDTPGYFLRPKGIAVDPEGRVYVGDASWCNVQVFSPEGQLLLVFGGPDPVPGGMSLPAGIAIDATSLKYFESYVAKGFEAEYLIFVANQEGDNKINVYAFGNSRLAHYAPVSARATAASRPAGEPMSMPTGLPGRPKPAPASAPASPPAGTP